MNEFLSACYQFVPVRAFRQAKTLLYLVLGLLLPTLGNATTVWIDTDVAIGSPFREVDDAFALVLAVGSSNLTIAGISSSYGNASLSTTTAAARLLISKLNPRLAVHPGAASPRDHARKTEATEALATTLRKQRFLTYIALGPLTNLAAFQAIHPDLARRIKRVIFIGGTIPRTTLRFGSRHSLRIHDANVVKDPAAVGQVLRSRIPITFVPIQTAANLTVDATDLEAMRGYAAGNFIQKKSRFWLWFWTKFVGTEGGPIFDAAAILAVAKPEQVTLEPGFATVDSGGNLIVSKARRPEARAVSFVSRISKRAHESVAEKLHAR